MGRAITPVVRACCNSFYVSMLENTSVNANMSLINFVKKLLHKQKKMTKCEECEILENNNVKNKITLSKTSSLPPNLSLNEIISDINTGDILESHSSPVRSRRKYLSLKNRTVAVSPIHLIHSSPAKTRRKYHSMKNRSVSPSNNRVKLKSTEHLFFPETSARESHYNGKNINSRKLSIKKFKQRHSIKKQNVVHQSLHNITEEAQVSQYKDGTVHSSYSTNALQNRTENNEDKVDAIDAATKRLFRSNEKYCDIEYIEISFE